MTRILAWLTAIAAWGCMAYAIAAARPFIDRQGYALAQRSQPHAEYRLTRAEGLRPSSERYDGQFRAAGGVERIEWKQDGQPALLEWTVVRRTGSFIPDGEPVRLRYFELRAPLKAGMTIRMVRMSYPTGYYFVILDERGEMVSALEVIWNT